MTVKPKRFLFIDQFRGWAVLLMIETHVLNAFLRSDLFSSGWYRAVDFLNGLIAPAFLFIAGFALAIVAGRKWENFVKLDGLFWKQLGRYLLVWLTGYCLRVNGFSFRWLYYGLRSNQPKVFFGVDILHCIAASLVLMLFLIPVCRRRAVLFTLLAVLAVAVILLTPFVYGLPVEKFLPLPLANYFKRLPYSRFPLLPWSAYALAGAVGSHLWQRARETGGEERFVRATVRLAAPLTVFTAGLMLLPRGWIMTTRLSAVNPVFILLKLSLVTLILVGCWHWERSGRKMWPPATLVGQESLLVYAAHIALLFGPLWGSRRQSLAVMIGQMQTPLEIVPWIGLLTVVMLCLAAGWHWLKNHYPLFARRMLMMFWFLVLMVFWLRH